MNRDLYPVGLMTMKSPHGNDIWIFNLERTVCDVLRSRNQMDIQFVNEMSKKYAVHQNRNIDRLYDYTRQFRVNKKVKEYIEVLL